MHAALMALLSFGSTARAGCDASSLLGLINDAEMAFSQMDADTFEDAAAEVDRVLACQQEPLSALQCAAYHRVRALDAFLRDDKAATILSFRSALGAQPGWSLSPAIAPEGHPLREQFELAGQFSFGATIDLAEPATGWLAVDGTPTTKAPAELPFLFQRFSRDGEVLATAYVRPGTPLPEYPVKTASAAPPQRRPFPLRPVLIGAGATLGATAVGLYGGAFATRAAYDEAVAEGDEERIRASRATTNGLVLGSFGALGAGATLVVVGLTR